MRTGTRAAFAGMLLVAATLTAETHAASAAARAGGDGRQQESEFVDRINALRTSKGLVALQVDDDLTTQARIWASTMRDQGHIFHSQNLADGISANWEKLGENVGVGGTVDALFNAFVASPKHYENLVDPAYRFIGIGVVWDGTNMYTAHRFMGVFPPGVAPAPTPTPTTAAPAPAPRQRRQSPTGAAAPSRIPATTTSTSTTSPNELAATQPPPSTRSERAALVLAALAGLGE